MDADATTSAADPASPWLVIGVGNRDRGDDAVGPVVVDALRDVVGERIATLVVEGDLSDLAVRWRADQAVVIIDAMRSGLEPGRYVETDALLHALPGPQQTLSSHGFGVAAAVELARLLDRLPRSLTVIGVEARSFVLGASLSPAVRAVVPVLVERIAGMCLGPSHLR